MRKHLMRKDLIDWKHLGRKTFGDENIWGMKTFGASGGDGKHLGEEKIWRTRRGKI